MTCPTCRSERYGCTPGRCFGPASAADVAPPAPLRKPDPRAVGTRQLHHYAKVLAAELKRGRAGGLYWQIMLDCGCEQWRWAGSATQPKKRPGPHDICIVHSSTPAIHCAGGCARVAERLERYEKAWVFCRDGWYCSTCWDLLGVMVRRHQAGRTPGDSDEEAKVDCASGCGALATEKARCDEAWVLCRRLWFCAACARLHVFGEPPR